MNTGTLWQRLYYDHPALNVDEVFNQINVEEVKEE